MTKAVTTKPSRASKRHREQLRQQADVTLERMKLVSEALAFYRHDYMRRVVLDAQVLIRLLVNEL